MREGEYLERETTGETKGSALESGTFQDFWTAGPTANGAEVYLMLGAARPVGSEAFGIRDRWGMRRVVQ